MKKIIILVMLVAILVLSGLIWWYNGIKPVDRKDTSYKIFIVKKGSGVREIANNLKRERLISDPVVFFLLVKNFSLDQKIQAGDFRLSPAMSASDIAHALTRGSLDIWITIPEGYRADEIADLLRGKIPSYQESWRDILREHEGYLFPDTYLIPKDAPMDLVVKIMTENFDKKFAPVENKSESSLSKKEIITIASLVEREARFPDDRPLVASVMLNRLGLGMKLDIDATVQYALGYQETTKTWWKKALTEKDKAIASPYNTYRNSGLPPTPIANPGLDAIEAVVYPAKTDYLYYVSDTNGHNHYAETIEEHNANIKKYGI